MESYGRDGVGERLEIDLLNVDNDLATIVDLKRFDDLFDRQHLLALKLLAAIRANIERAHFVVGHRLDARLTNLLRFMRTDALEIAVVEHHNVSVFGRAYVDLGYAAHSPG